MTPEQVAKHIDYTILKFGTTQADVERVCAQAVEKKIAAVCIPPLYISLAKELTRNTSVKVCTVVGFPLGYQPLAIKLKEMETYAQLGAQEVDVVFALSAFLSGDQAYVQKELRDLSHQAKQLGVILKVIIESGLLSMEAVEEICRYCTEAEVDYVKTSTGFAGMGAELEKVRRMREVLPSHIRVKASGGIRTLEQAIAFIEAGADRIGTSSLFV